MKWNSLTFFPRYCVYSPLVQGLGMTHIPKRLNNLVNSLRYLCWNPCTVVRCSSRTATVFRRQSPGPISLDWSESCLRYFRPCRCYWVCWTPTSGAVPRTRSNLCPIRKRPANKPVKYRRSNKNHMPQREVPSKTIVGRNEKKKNRNYRFARAQTVFNVALEYYAVRLREPERFVDGLKCVAFGRKSGEDGRIHRTPFVVNDLERALRVLGHGYAAPREYTVRCCVHTETL